MSEERPTFGALWASYERATVSRNAGSFQRREVKRAFYAGAAAFLDVMLRSLSPGEGEPTPADFAALDGLREELVEFMNQQRRERWR